MGEDSPCSALLPTPGMNQSTHGPGNSALCWFPVMFRSFRSFRFDFASRRGLAHAFLPHPLLRSPIHSSCSQFGLGLSLVTRCREREKGSWGILPRSFLDLNS